MEAHRVLLIDDEPLARMLVAEYLQQFPEFQVIGECENGFDGAKAIHQLKPDLIFLDIQMPKLTGFEMLELLDDTPFVIFTTAFDEFALKAFEAGAIDYLLKPFSEDRFKKAIEKWKSGRAQLKSNVEKLVQTPGKSKEETDRIVVKNGASVNIIPVSDVYFIEAYDDYVKIHTKNDCFLKKQTISYFESILPDRQFSRVHRSFILRLDTITRIESFEKNSYIALLNNGKKVPLSRTGYPKLKEQFGL